MGIASKFNKKVVDWGVNTDKSTFVKANELEEGKLYSFKGCWTTPDNGYGEGGVIITEINNELKLVNTPQSFVETIKLIRQDEESILAIKDGKLGFKVVSYMSKFKRKGFRIDLVDVEPSTDSELPFK